MSVSELSLRDKIRHYFRQVYPEHSQIPAKEGGVFFHELANILGVREAVLADIAREIGLWPYTNHELLRLLSPPTKAKKKKNQTSVETAWDNFFKALEPRKSDDLQQNY